jgi:choline dehydrogenase-like flavoprotein
MTVGSTHDQGDDLVQRVRRNQRRLASQLKSDYDFVVCGAGSSGCVIARRLSESPDTTVLLLEAGSDDEMPSVTEAALWPTNLGTEVDWAFQVEPNAHLGGRALTLSMGKVLGGGSSINVMAWVHGHKNDWDRFAAESTNQAWSYQSVLDIYRQVEDWHGPADAQRRGTGGPVYVQSAVDPSPSSSAILEAASSLGVERFDSPNGQLMEKPCGAATTDLTIRDGKRQSIYRSYTFPYMDRPNLTVLSDAAVRRVIINGKRASGVEFTYRGETRQVAASAEVVLSLGAVNTPKVLMLSGIGDRQHLRDHGIPVIEHLAGVGRNLQDHVAVTCVWESPSAWPARQSGDAVIFWPSSYGLDTPEWLAYQGSTPFASPEHIARFGLPDAGWMLHGALTRPRSRGFVELRSSDPADDVRIVHNALSHPDDLLLAMRCVETMRELGNSASLRPYVKREIMPGNLKNAELLCFLRSGAMTYWHPCGTAKMGQGPSAVVDGRLKVYGIDRLRVVDASIMPTVTIGNTMAPCVVIGERAAAEMKLDHRL